jgi:transcriptional regulator with XRE-family HTH domain
MITQQKADEVEKLLAAGGLSQRDVAIRAGISRSTVQQMVAGKWRPKRLRAAPRPDVPRAKGFCVACGVDTKLPCLVCQLRKHLHRIHRFDDSDEELALDLWPEYEERRLEVVARRLPPAAPESPPYEFPEWHDTPNTEPRHVDYRPSDDSGEA